MEEPREELELTWDRFVRIAWLVLWRMVVLGIAGGVAATYVFHKLYNLALGNEGPPGMGALVWLPIIVLCVWMLLRKRFRGRETMRHDDQGFRIALISTRQPARPTAHLYQPVPDGKKDA